MAEKDPKPVGRRARNRAAREVFQHARDRGLVLRHRMKLRHLAEREKNNDNPEGNLAQ
ncbi:hypothetical protein ACIBCH_36690 [Amycolatopsis thailandensis]|uniref:hypothetical protein n=1 Tax=Amycolatopsis thailandensis TaxID=589330 RepID=UPI0037B60B74